MVARQTKSNQSDAELRRVCAEFRGEMKFPQGDVIITGVSGLALWAAFNVEMDRLNAIMSEGSDLDMGG